MFIDARQLPDGTRIEAELAIIGGGPAGITLARGFAGRGAQVCLIESGGFDHEPETQALYEGESVGIGYPLASSRLRYFGGSSGHWGGFCRPLDPIDFEQRDWVPLSGWPFDRSELDPYWERASQAVEIGPARFEDGAYWSEHTGEPLVHWRAGRFMTRFFQFSPPTRFGQRYRQELQQDANIRVLLHANVTNIAADPSAQTVDRLDLRTLSGRSHQVRARRYVLAAGGIENARLLLLSNDVVSAGLGNQHDMVGRCFMEHPHMGGFAEIVIADPRRLPTIYREPVLVDGRTARVSYVPDPDYLRSKRLLSASFTMSIVGDVDTGPGGQDEAAVANTTMLGAAWPFLTEQRPQASAVRGFRMGIGCACEQMPNPDSRVMLSDERDALGLRRTRLDWRLSEQDRRSLIANIRSLGREFAAAGIGRMQLRLADDSPWEAQVGGGSHHMGTTRISSDPKRGVVDANCRVHGIDNLYVAGSSVFATSGSANPTLNIVALAYRLADHLQGTAA